MALRALLARVRAQVEDDLRADPYLPYIVLLAGVLCSFWFWHRIPNFATRDEKSRLLDAMVPMGRMLADPSIETLQRSVEWSRVPFGPTLYLFGLALLPVLLVSVLTGDLNAFTGLGFPPDPEFGYYPVWHGTPEWIWTWSLVFVRLFNVAFAVGAVYLTYRLGTELRDRATGRLAALVLTLTFGFLTIAHEGGEDMPALFFLLLALVLLVRYVRAGDGTAFFAASAAGGIAIAFKLTAAPIVPLIGVGFVLRAWGTDGPTLRALFRPRLVVGGALLGLVAILAGYPTFLVGSFEPVFERLFGQSMERGTRVTGPTAPVWWWFLRGYFSALGLPLFVAALAGVVASLAAVRDRATYTPAYALTVLPLVTYLLLFSRWHDFRVHHLLPTFPLIALLLALSLIRLREWDRSVGTVVIALMLVTTGIYAGVGVGGYASMPRDEATDWLQENADENATMEVYRRDFHDAAIPHDMRINHLFGPESDAEEAAIDDCPEYIQLGYRDLLYLKNGTYYRNGKEQQQYFRELLSGEYSYRIVAEFGPRPPNFVPDRPTPGSLTDLFHVGLVPQTDQYADEQELAENQYTVILQRDSACGYGRFPPF
ncbi:dolichyl-phosphate-mannose--protein mannosyltransferase [Halorientalis sp. IM1011]|uniref:ArnT family glycosyltransferase n=1 Tax=Halorientalis sp. IM1011 TaxID=1932360 RepID=UPI00097CCB3C|nr:glycosyltransferase family 39 protein [Halorientalis sp. IM1011]AQL41438.1 dolichyl-phosphate-mannose--protein mannosyltransferase [Halorientalis sp. IM1011]